MGQSKSGQRATATRLRDEQAVMLRAGGLTLNEIAGALDFRDRSGAYQSVMRGLVRRVEENDGKREQLRAMEVARCDDLEQKLLDAWDNAAATDNAAFALAALANALNGVRSRRAKLLGLDAPVKIDAAIRPAPIEVLNFGPPLSLTNAAEVAIAASPGNGNGSRN